MQQGKLRKIYLWSRKFMQFNHQSKVKNIKIMKNKFKSCRKLLEMDLKGNQWYKQLVK